MLLNISPVNFVSYNKNRRPEAPMKGTIAMSDKLVITKKQKGDDGCRVFSVRIKQETFEQLERLSAATGRTRNELIGILLDYSLERSEVATAH